MGLIHIYCGDGKGKTTAALGLCLRAVGSGMSVHIVQLMKGDKTGELALLEKLPNVTVERCDKNYGFFKKMSETDKQSITLCHNRLLSRAYEIAVLKKVDMLIIDEFNCAYNFGLLDKKLAKKIVFEKPENTELILTGRYPDEKFIKAADYVSEIKCIKHPYQKGIKARIGIEY